MVLGGFYLGIAQETFRRFARHWKSRTFLAYFMEVSFWLTQTFILYYILFRVNSGELRVYVFVAGLLGFSIYQVIAANIYKRLLERLIVIGIDIYEFLARVVNSLVFTPVKYIVQAMITIILFIVNAIFVVLKYVLFILLSPIKWMLNVIYRMLPKKIHVFFHNLAGFYSKIKNIYKKWLEYIALKRR